MQTIFVLSLAAFLSVGSLQSFQQDETGETPSDTVDASLDKETEQPTEDQSAQSIDQAPKESVEDKGEVETWLPPAESENDSTESDSDYENNAPFDDLLQADDLPYGKGEMELGFGLGGWGGSGYFSLSVGGSFAYYVAPRLAPGISLDYQTIFGELKYPQSFTTLPYLKFVIVRSRAFAPYLVAAGGREFQWSGTDDPEKGYAAVGSWIAGGGIGAHIGMGGSFALNLQVLFLYYFFDESVYIAGKDEPQDGNLSIPISIGISFLF